MSSSANSEGSPQHPYHVQLVHHPTSHSHPTHHANLAASSAPDRPKRKRLAKACDACHKSKRRCDGTAPCSNCYFASKPCTYTDANGRPVPAPRVNAQPQSQSQSRATGPPYYLPPPQLPPPAPSYSSFSPSDPPPQTRKRPREVSLGNVSAVAKPQIDLDAAMTRELTNLFFTHAHPCLTILHKPSFTNALSLNQVPMHLLYAVCALAARYSKQPSLRVTPGRYSGRHFADEAIRMMFGPPSAAYESTSGDRETEQQLLLPPTLHTAQALCLLCVYYVLATDEKPIAGRGRSSKRRRKDASVEKETDQNGNRREASQESASSLDMDEESGVSLRARGERLRDLTLQTLQTLGIHNPDHPLLTPVPSQEFIEKSIERECVRRTFWMIYILDCVRGIYYRWEIPLLGGSGSGYGNRNRGIFSSNISNSDPKTNHDSASGSIPFSNLNISRNAASFSPPIPAWAFTETILGYSEAELRLRLPVDETSFEMGVVYECLPEHLYLPSPPAPSTNLPNWRTCSPGSELAQMIRILTIFHKVERTLDYLFDPSARIIIPNSIPQPQPPPQTDLLVDAMSHCRKMLAIWKEGLPPHLQWDDGENVILQKSMLETSSNTGAWSFCVINALEASCVLGLAVGCGEGCEKDLYCAPGTEGWVKKGKIKSGEWCKDKLSKDGTSELTWAVKRLESVLEMMNERAKCSMVLGVSLWPMVKYLRRDDMLAHQWVDDFEDYCGVRLDEVASGFWEHAAAISGEAMDVDEGDSAINGFGREVGRMDQPLMVIEGTSANNEERERNRERISPVSLSSSGPTSSISTSLPSSSSVTPSPLPPSGPTPHMSHLPVLQTQTSLPSLKSSGLLNWNPHTSTSHSHSLSHSPGSLPSHPGLAHPNIRTGNLGAFPAGNGSASGPMTMAAPTPSQPMSISSISHPGILSEQIPTFGSAQAQVHSQSQAQPQAGGRSGLSWMMNH